MNTEVANRPEQAAVEAQKREAWGTMGVVVYRKELDLQVQAQASLSKLENPPNTIEEVPAAELALKEVKADQKIIEAARKEITSKFDAVTQRLMEPEKSFAVPITDFANAIIKVKKEHEKKEAEKQLKAQELKRIREQIATAVSSIDAAYKGKIADKVNAYYAYALGEGNITPAKSEEFLRKAGAKLTDADFTPQRPNTSPSYASPDDVNALVDELFLIVPSNYTAKYIIELEQRFSDYEIAYNNKQQAIEIAKKELEEKQQAIAVEQQNNVIAAQLDFSSTPLDIQPAGVKALKKAYEIDMPETFENAMKILSAFLANKNLCQPKTTVKKWFSFDAASAAKALAKVKCDDDAFAPVGIIFKEVDKL